MRWFTLFLLAACMVPVCRAHHPDRENHPVWPRINLIPPIGYNLPMEYRRRYNRPTKIGGWIAYHIEPTSQEAMAWHEATHQNAYKDKRGRLEKHYFYPKPWEGLKIGPRVSVLNQAEAANEAASRDYVQDALKGEEDILSASDELHNSGALIEETQAGRTPSASEVDPPSIDPPASDPASREAVPVELNPSQN